MSPPWTQKTRPPRLGKRADAFPTPPTAVLGLGKSKKNTTRACARARNQTTCRELNIRMTHLALLLIAVVVTWLRSIEHSPERLAVGCVAESAR